MTLDDSDSPPVLAHQRFVNDQASFAGLDLQQRFRRIHDTNLWGATASTSGLGSELDATAVLRAELSGLFQRLGGGWRERSLGVWRLAELGRPDGPAK